jgi:hypothetical protein
MALVWMDGFDWLDEMAADSDAQQCLLKRYASVDTSASSPNGQIVAGRGGIGRALMLGYYAQQITTHLVNEAAIGTNTVIFGYAFKMTAFYNAQPMVEVWRAAQRCGYLRFFTDATMQWYPGGDVFASGVLANGGWNYMECRVTPANGTGGSVNIRLNGRQIYEKLGFDSTLASDGDGWTNMRWKGHGTGSALDDLYICNAEGAENNDFLGDIRVLSSNPASDFLTEWDQAGVGGHFEEIDDQPLSAGLGGEPWTDVSYIEDDTPGNKCLFEYGDVTPGFINQEVKGLQLATAVRVTNTQSLRLKNILRSGATDEEVSDNSLMWDTYQPVVSISELDPDTTDPWTVTGINATKFGVEVG